MILLTSINDLLQVITATPVTTIYVHATYMDYSGGVVTPGRLNTQITAGAPTTTNVVGSPTTSTQRNVKSLVIQNGHATSSETITIQHTDGSTVAQLFKYTLLAGETIQYFDTLGFQVLDAAGGLKQAASTGRLLGVIIKTSGTTYTSNAAAKQLRVRCIASGGSGGGNPATTNTAGSGGGAGGYVEKLYTGQVGGTTYTIAIGGSKTGTSGAIGTAGAITTFTDGSTLITAQAGTAGLLGVASTSVAGGAESTISTNGDVNGAGAPGQIGISSATSAQGGSGGSTSYGAGGGSATANLTVGRAAVGFGGGGGGSCTIGTATAQAGGSSGAGLIIIEEYT